MGSPRRGHFPRPPPSIEGNKWSRSWPIGQVDWHTATMYFLMVDRFVDGNQQQRTCQGCGIRLKPTTRAATCKALSNASLRLLSRFGAEHSVDSPVTQNAEGPGDCGKTAPAPTSPAIQRVPWLLARELHPSGPAVWLPRRWKPHKAHEREMNVVLDYVANHVHEDHP